MDAASLAAVHDSLQAAVPGDSPQVVLVAGSFDAGTLATVDWLTRRHGLEISCFALSVFRFGAERLLSIRREYPARDVAAVDPAAEVQRMLSGAGAHRRCRAGRQRPLDAARRSSSDAPHRRRAPAAVSHHPGDARRRLRWGLAGALVAWTRDPRLRARARLAARAAARVHAVPGVAGAGRARASRRGGAGGQERR